MADSRMEHVEQIRERVQRNQYTVDASAVAAAIVERLMDGRPSGQERDQR